MELNYIVPVADMRRVTHKYHSPCTGSLGEGLPHGINQVCISCKAGSCADAGVVAPHAVERVTDEVILRAWGAWHPEWVKAYAVYGCHFCGAIWSWVQEEA